MALVLLSRVFVVRALTLLAVLSILSFRVAAQDDYLTNIPDPKSLGGSYVSDPDQLLQPATVQALNDVLRPLDQSGRAHIDVVLTRSIGEEVPKTAATALFNRWKIGDAEKDNGLLMLLVLDQRRVEFETGYGLEADLPDVICYRIQQRYMLPHLREGRYDSAVTRGVQALMQHLNAAGDPAALEQLAAAEEPGEVAETPHDRWMTPAIVTSIFLWPLLFTIAWFIAPAGYRSRWALLLGLMPLAITALVGVLQLTVGSIWLFVGLSYLLPWGYLHWHLWQLNQRYEALPPDMSRQDRYLYLQKHHDDLPFGAFFFPVGLAFYWFWNRRRMHALRAAPYPCPNCAGTMPRLDEKQDDTLLEPGQAAEEKVESVDYDVYQCTQCHHTLTIRYQNPSTDVRKCPECQYLTLEDLEPTVEQAATTSSSGWGWKQARCANCQHEAKKAKYTIPQESSSSSSSGSSFSSGGSSSNSSSSGGSSGGGGAGSNW